MKEWKPVPAFLNPWVWSERLQCSICGSTNLLETSDCKWCARCHTVRTNYSYDPSIYNESYAQHYASLVNTPISRALNDYRLALVQDSEYILDFGCGVGEFVMTAQQAGKRCLGVEPNLYARMSAKIGLSSRLDGFRNFDAITLFDVLEHLEDSQKLISDLKPRLSPFGSIVIVTPNVDAVKFGDEEALCNWKHFKPREHLWNFSFDSLDRMARKVGMKITSRDYKESSIRPGNPNNDLITVVMR